jgi:hypothetical protein
MKKKTNGEIQALKENEMRNISTKEDFRKDAFRVAIFGSARIKPNDKTFQEVMTLAKEIAKLDIDVVTGGGPGIMEAASLGHQMGASENSKSIGLTIELPWENEGNQHLDKQKHFQKFSNRLDTFMKLSNVVIVMPGGIGTCLELFYTWQLTQVKHICSIPILLHGKMWHQLYKWVKKYPVKNGLVSPDDLNNVLCVKNNKQTLEVIKDRLKAFQEKGPDDCVNSDQYKL